MTATAEPATTTRTPPASRRGGSRRPSRPGEARAAAGFLAVDGAGLLAFIMVPTVLALVMGLFNVDGFGSVTFVGLDNFRLMLTDRLFWKSLGVTGLYAVLFVPVAFVAGLGLALLVRDRFPGVGAVRAIFFVPNVVSLIVVGLLWQFLLTDKTGIVARMFGSSNSWLGDPGLALPTLVVISVWFLMGYQMLIFLAGLQDIPREQYDAATVDGAGPWRTFWNVTWPGLRPTSFFVLVTSMINAIVGLQAFDLVYATTRGGPANATSTIVYYAYQQAFLYGQFGYASAICGVLVIVTGLITGGLFALTRGGRFDEA